MSLVALASPAAAQKAAAAPGGTVQTFLDPTGVVQTVTTNPTIDLGNPFFQVLGTNGRSCVTCHQPSDAWTVTPPHLRERFLASRGTDPIFRLNDGATCDNQDVSTLANRLRAYSLLLDKGLIRIALPIPANAEFTVTGISDPYGCSTATTLSVYRRPLPATNLPFLSTVMWDGRETVPGQPVTQDLISQARNATLGHGQALQSPSDDQLAEIVAFELGLFTAQTFDIAAGRLDVLGAQGGPSSLSQQEFFIGINDPLGQNPTGAAFNPEAFTLFQAWGDLPGGRDRLRSAARASIARGEALFNTRPINITNVAGLNDVLARQVIPGTCTTCHDTPNVGDHSVVAPLNIGVSDAARRTPDLPLFTLTCTSGEVVQTSDPGRALISGKCADIGKVKGPVLRGLAARAPYFHNGSAATVAEVIDFYDTRFDLGLSQAEKADLVAFLRSL
jgi:hypothetical protein